MSENETTNPYPHCFPTKGPGSPQDLLSTTRWGCCRAEERQEQWAHKTELEEAQKLIESLDDACEHCGASSDDGPLWTCMDRGGLPVLLCEECHEENHDHPLHGDFERDIVELTLDYQRFRDAVDRDD